MASERCLASLLFVTAACAGGAEVDVELARGAILEGHPAGADEQWGTVGLDVFVGMDDGWTCTGTLIGPRLVVTAAHCVMPGGEGEITALYVVAGASDLFAASPEQMYEVARHVAHPEAFRGGGSLDAAGLGAENDIAIIETVEPVTEVDVVPVLPLSRVDEVLAPGTVLTIAGYGVTTVAELDEGYAEALHNVGDTRYVRRSDHEFLAGGEDQADTCLGDSGGPAYAFVGGQATLVGATSRGREDASADCGEGGIYTLVPAYLAWIEATTALPFGEEPVTDGGSAAPDAGDEHEPGQTLRRSRRRGCALGAGSTSDAGWPWLTAIALLASRRLGPRRRSAARGTRDAARALHGVRR
jgi:hypothetical protein